ncbi:MAG: Coenzyme F420 hydrogenase/dehydrogenase, beta subunit C-terminal domain [Chromatiales bacterium]|jgi:coenzyme F420 hydrogenase subunit beta
MTPDAIVAGGLCTGCGACSAVVPAIVMDYSANGFLRPRATGPLGADDVESVNAVCPGIRVARAGDDEARTHPIWGPVVSVHIGHAVDPALRWAGASGGALSAILVSLLENAEVAHVVETAASESDPLRNRTLSSRSREDVLAAAGSRYAPSSPLATIDRYLRQPQRFAFVGKPCDVVALRRLARRDGRVDDKVAVMLSFLCAGIPSELGSVEILDSLRVARADVRGFRYRGNGWPGATRVDTASGETRRLDYDAAWGGVLNRHLQWRCKICPDGTGEFADIACGDGWHLDTQGRPDFAERPGRSLIIARTAKGERIVDDAIRRGHLDARPLPIDAIARMQPFQKKRKSEILVRLLAMRTLLQRVPTYTGLGLFEAMRYSPPHKLVQGYLATLVRLLQRGRS